MNEYQPTSNEWLDEEPFDQEEFDSKPADQLDLNSVRHPEITVRLSDGDGNAFGILGKVQQAFRRAGVDEKEIDVFFTEATSGDYDHLLATCMAWVNVE